MKSLENSKEAIIAEITKNFEPLKTALENIGFTVKLTAYAGRVDYRAGGHVSIKSHLREWWGCQFSLHATWNSGKIERITIKGRPMRTVTLKFTEKAIPGILQRVQASFDADVAEEAKRKQDAAYGDRWARQAILDTNGIDFPDCMIPSWRRDSEKNRQVVAIESLHKGIPETPIGRYFPEIDEKALAGTEGLTAAQLKYLAECLKKLPTIA